MRFGVAGLLGSIVPGAGHLFVGRRRDALVFLLPTAAIVGALIGAVLAVGWIGVLAFLVTPGVLRTAAAVNVAIAAWRVLAAMDGARLEPPTRRSLGLLVVGLAVLVIVPHLLAGRLIASTSDFLDSMFAVARVEVPSPSPSPSGSLPGAAEPEPEPEPTDTGRSGPSWADGRRLPDNAIDGAGGLLPTATPDAAGPYDDDGGDGLLPPLGAAVPWDAPGAVPWGDDGRFDLLLLGSDASGGRWSRRMDVMLLVEVDVATGRTAMIGLPRNLQNAPYPAGAARDAVACGCITGFLNEAYVEATARHPKRWPGSGAIKGIGAVRGVVSELTGRPIDAVLVADLKAVIEVVDALGGIDVDVPTAVFDDRYPDPIRGRIRLSIPAGPQHMDGRIALAYARSRHFSSDYSRMERQQTLLLAIRSQIGPMTLFQAPDLFAATERRAWTDLKRDSLPALVQLFGRAAGASVTQLRIVPPTYAEWLTDDEIDRIRSDIAGILGPVPDPIDGAR